MLLVVLICNGSSYFTRVSRLLLDDICCVNRNLVTSTAADLEQLADKQKLVPSTCLYASVMMHVQGFGAVVPLFALIASATGRYTHHFHSVW